MIIIDFEKKNEAGTMVYKDALYLPDDHTYTEADIEAMKQERFDRWLDIVMNPPVEAPSVEEPQPVIVE